MIFFLSFSVFDHGPFALFYYAACPDPLPVCDYDFGFTFNNMFAGNLLQPVYTCFILFNKATNGSSLVDSPLHLYLCL